MLVLWIGYGATRRSVAADAEGADTLLRQSMAEAQARNFAACLESAKGAIRLSPKLAEAHNNAGWCAANLGKWDEGIASLREAIRLKPDFELARNNLNQAVSERDGEKSAAQTPADAALLESLRAARAQRYPECIASAQKSISLNPRLAEAYNNLGYCYGAMANWDEGIKNMRTALELRPDFPLASNNLTWIESEKAKARANARR